MFLFARLKNYYYLCSRNNWLTNLIYSTTMTHSKHILALLAICTLALYACTNSNPSHPLLSLTQDDARLMHNSLGKYPVFDASFDYALRTANEALAQPIDVPEPQHAAGGYTHEQHKNNYYAMYYAGILYQVTGEKRYAEYVRDMLLQYADKYRTWGQHPYKGSPVPGRMFWQTLNESVWLVHTAMAYDCVYDIFTKEERAHVENNLLFQVAEFVERGTEANYATFNRMHNHATWANAAVGMTGYATGNRDLVERALYGSEKDGKAGFLLQLEQLFSPEGYFTEGAYYLRYAIWPFMLFAQAIEINDPELHIFARRDGILLKAVNALLQQAYNGTIIRANDALKKTYSTQEIVAAVDIAYWASRDPQLLSIARQQGSFVLSSAGIATARAIAEHKEEPFVYRSMLYRDGADGSQGGMVIIRRGSEQDKQFMLVFKATSHGLSHGHYDKLTYSIYDNGHEILTDYGAARFLNIESKSGGRYTHENDTYAMQSVAHNTAVVDCESHFGADYRTSMRYASTIHYASLNDTCAVVSATDSNPYRPKQVVMQRTLAVFQPEGTEFPMTLDIMRLHAPAPHTYDLPFHYNGHLINSSFPARKQGGVLYPMQGRYGYEHLWKECETTVLHQNASFTILQDNRFYSVTTTLDNGRVFLVRSGANDPDNNLRNEPAVIFREEGKSDYVFATVVEPHGLFDPNLELTKGAVPPTEQISVLFNDDTYTAVSLCLRGKEQPIVFIAVNRDFGENVSHRLTVNGKEYTWTGNYSIWM